MRPTDGLRNRYEKPYPHGIGCERCHGPGQKHVEKWRSGEVPTGEPDPTIVHPRRLPPALRLDVCFQCHLGDAKSTERVVRAGRSPSAFRPGRSFLENELPYHYETPTRHEFGLSSQADRLLISRCYTESGGRIECLTCHNPHVTVYREDRPLDFFQKRCLTCHEIADCTAPPSDRRATTPLADDCVHCHMRKAEPDDQRFTEFTDHWIRKDIRGDDERDHRRDFTIVPMWPDVEAGLSDAERAYYRGRAVYRLARDVPRREYEAMWRTADTLLEQATQQGLRDAEAWFFLGRTRRDLGRRADAADAFRKAFEIDPAFHDSAYAYAQSLLEAGEIGRAVEILQGMLRRKADDPMALAEIGRALQMLSRDAEAFVPFDRAVAIEPWDWMLHLGRGKVLAAQGRFEDALGDARDAVRLNPDEPEVWSFYEKLHDAAGRPDEAREGRRILQQLSPVAPPAGH
jgi:Flp pilus assembly protein TadD